MALVILLITPWATPIFSDADTFWHLAAGNWMLKHHAVPGADPFSWTFLGQPWVAHEWLSEVLMALVFRISGWSGLALLTAGAGGATVWLVARVAVRWTGGLVLCLIVLLGLGLTAPHYLVRPHILIMPVMAAWAGELVEARADNRAPRLWFLPLMTLWANMHGSFLFGLCLWTPFALEAWLAASSEQRLGVTRTWGLFGFGALVACLVTPHGLDGLIFPIKLLFMPGIDAVGEWQPYDFGKLSLLPIALLAAVGTAIRQKARVSLLRVILLIGLLYLTLRHVRQEMVLGLVGALVLAEPLGRTFTGAMNGKPGTTIVSKGALLSPAFLIILLVIARLSIPSAEPHTPNTPKAALAAVPADVRATNVFNIYDYGGYLIWKGVPTYIDGRTDLYGPNFFGAYSRAAAPDPVLLGRILADRRIGWTLLPAGTVISDAVAAMPGWHRLYSDHQAVVYVRN